MTAAFKIFRDYEVTKVIRNDKIFAFTSILTGKQEMGIRHDERLRARRVKSSKSELGFMTTRVRGKKPAAIIHGAPI